MARIWIPLPDRDFDITEVSVPWRMLRDAGHEVVFATELGGKAPAADPLLITGVVFGKLGADPEPLAFYRQLEDAAEFRNPVSWAAVEPLKFDALVLPGGHAQGMKQYLGSERLQGLVARFFATGRPVAAICHGVLVAARSMGDDGRSALHGRKTTCLVKYMERLAYFSTFWKLGKYYRTYPEYVEDEVRRALADPGDFVRGPITIGPRGTIDDDTHAFVVEDGPYVSARWPGDAYLFARKLLERL